MTDTTHEGTIDGTSGLKIAVSDLSPARRSLSIEVAGDRVTAELDHTYRRYMKNLRVPGFRAGKVPAHVVRQRFGREIEQEAVEHVIQHALQDAVAQVGLKPLRAPVLKDYTHTPGETVTFVAELEVMPDVEAKGYKDIRVKLAEPVVTDKMLGEAIENLRERAARFDPVEGRGIAPGDHALVDVKGIAGTGEPFGRDKVMVEIGSGGIHPEWTEHVRDMAPGETRSFTVVYPESHPQPEMAGRTVSYTVTTHEIKRKVLPDLDDEFARDFGSFQNLEELRRRVAEDLILRERRRGREEARSAVIEQLLSGNPDVTAPDVLVEEEVSRRIDDLANSMAMQGIEPSRAEIDWDAIRERQRESGAKTVQATLLLDAIAKQEKIDLGQEALDAALSAEAERRKTTMEILRAKLAKDGRLERLAEQLLREKVLDFLLTSADT